MNRKRETVESVQSDVIDAAARVRAVAQAERDEPRVHAADWLTGTGPWIEDGTGKPIEGPA